MLATRFHIEEMIKGGDAINLAQWDPQRGRDKLERLLIQITECLLDRVQGFDQSVSLVAMPPHGRSNYFPPLIIAGGSGLGEICPHGVLLIGVINTYPKIPFFMRCPWKKNKTFLP
jgi:hypothetical protein